MYDTGFSDLLTEVHYKESCLIQHVAPPPPRPHSRGRCRPRRVWTERSVGTVPALSSWTLTALSLNCRANLWFETMPVLKSPLHLLTCITAQQQQVFG